MSSLRLQDTILLADQHPELSFGQVQQFISFSRLKDDILLTQPSSVLVLHPPDVLPLTVSTFLQNSCGISMACVEACWDTLKTTIWHDAQSLKDGLIHDFSAHGHSLGLCAFLFHSLWVLWFIVPLFSSCLYSVSPMTYLYQCKLFTQQNREITEEERAMAGCVIHNGQGRTSCVFHHLYCDGMSLFTAFCHVLSL